MTHSCSNYVDDGQTVFTSNGRLVLKVASACPDGSCLNSGSGFSTICREAHLQSETQLGNPCPDKMEQYGLRSVFAQRHDSIDTAQPTLP